MTYRYYWLGDAVPVRITFNDIGPLEAEIPDRDRGELVRAMTYMSRIQHSMEVDEITEDEFNKKVHNFLNGP